MKDNIKNICHLCNETATILDVDPFIEEIYPEEENEEEWWCDECYQTALDDI